MAITKIHPIKTTLQRSIDYICNPHKTDNQILISSFACSEQTAAWDFEASLHKAKKVSNENKAFHLIQSFMPGETNFDEAHMIGEELADELLKGKFSYVLTTHTDRGHIHNHLIFCAVDNFDHNKYLDNKQTYRNIRNISDKLCKEHGLSVIIPDVQKGKDYTEWRADKHGYSIKAQLKIDIFDCIRHAKDYENFIELMMDRGYEIKGSEIGENVSKYISFKPSDYNNYIRGSYRTLGKGYTKEDIIKRIDKQITSRLEWREKQKSMKLSEKQYIDTSGDAFSSNPGLERWGNITNLQIAASLYAEVGSMSELKERIGESERIIRENKSSLAKIDKQLKSLSEIIKYAKQYEENKSYDDAYKSAKNPDEYLRQNETNLLFFEGANNYLKMARMDTNNLDISRLIASYDELNSEKDKLKNITDSIIKEISDNNKKINKLNAYLGSNMINANLQKTRNEKSL